MNSIAILKNICIFVLQNYITKGEILKIYRNKNIANRCYGVGNSKEPKINSPLGM